MKKDRFVKIALLGAASLVLMACGNSKTGDRKYISDESANAIVQVLPAQDVVIRAKDEERAEDLARDLIESPNVKNVEIVHTDDDVYVVVRTRGIYSPYYKEVAEKIVEVDNDIKIDYADLEAEVKKIIEDYMSSKEVEGDSKEASSEVSDKSGD